MKISPTRVVTFTAQFALLAHPETSTEVKFEGGIATVTGGRAHWTGIWTVHPAELFAV